MLQINMDSQEIAQPAQQNELKSQTMIVGAQFGHEIHHQFQLIQDYFLKFQIQEKVDHLLKTIYLSQYLRNSQHKGITKSALLNQIKIFFSKNAQYSILYLIGHGKRVNTKYTRQTYLLWFQQNNSIPQPISFEDIVSLWQMSQQKHLLIIGCMCFSGRWQHKLRRLPQNGSISLITTSGDQQATCGLRCDQLLYQMNKKIPKKILKDEQKQKTIRNGILQNLTIQEISSQLKLDFNKTVLYFTTELLQKYFEQYHDTAVKSNARDVLQKSLKPQDRTNSIERRDIFRANFYKQFLSISNKYFKKQLETQSQTKTCIFKYKISTKTPRKYEVFQTGQLQNEFNPQFSYVYQGKNNHSFSGYGRLTTLQKGSDTDMISFYAKFQQQSQQDIEKGQIWNSKFNGQTLTTWKQHTNLNHQRWQFNQFTFGTTKQMIKRFKGLQIVLRVSKADHGYMQYYFDLNYYPKRVRQSEKHYLACQNIFSLHIQQQKIDCFRLNQKGKPRKGTYFKRLQTKNLYQQKTKPIYQLYKVFIKLDQLGNLKLKFTPFNDQKAQILNWDVIIHKQFAKKNCFLNYIIPGYKYTFQIYKNINFYEISQVIDKQQGKTYLKHFNFRIDCAIESLSSLPEQMFLNQRIQQLSLQNLQNSKIGKYDNNLKDVISSDNIYKITNLFCKKLEHIVKDNYQSQDDVIQSIKKSWTQIRQTQNFSKLLSIECDSCFLDHALRINRQRKRNMTSIITPVQEYNEYYQLSDLYKSDQIFYGVKGSNSPYNRFRKISNTTNTAQDIMWLIRGERMS